MSFTKVNKINKAFLVSMSLIVMLTACSQIESKSVNQQEDKPLASDNVKTSGSKTQEVFNIKKYESQLSVRFFLMNSDSKSGDAIFLRTPDGVTMLIDSGLEDCGAQVVGYLKKLGVEKLDYIVATHQHHDHIGGFPEVIANFKVGKALLNSLPYNSKNNQLLLDTLKTKSINTEFVKAGDTFTLGKEVQVKVLNPEPQIVIPEGMVPEKSDAFVNNKSIVMKITYKNKTFLFTGDIYSEKERELVENMKDALDVDVLKAPHHGANTSSSKIFIDAVSPKYTIFTSNKSFGLNEYNNYKGAGSEVYITGIDGNILLTSDGNNINVVTEKERVGSYLK